jgi:hypothetical protein
MPSPVEAMVRSLWHTLPFTGMPVMSRPRDALAYAHD